MQEWWHSNNYLRRSPQKTLNRDLRRLSLRVVAVHDEIKPQRNRNPFLAHGVLFVPEDWIPILVDSLYRIRKQYGFFDEVHWRTITGAGSNSQFCVAREWIKYYLATAIRGCTFKAFIVEDGPNRRFPYPGDIDYPEHLLKSTKASLKAGIAWSFHRERKVRLQLIFDDTDNEMERSIASQVHDVLQAECNTLRLDGMKRYPWLRVSPVEFHPSNPKESSSESLPYTEFIQLCDLLLGASFQALQLSQPPKNQPGRRQLAKSIMEVLAETLQVPWFQQIQVHRKFSVSLYPDKFNFAYPAALRMARSSCRPTGHYLPGPRATTHNNEGRFTTRSLRTLAPTFHPLDNLSYTSAVSRTLRRHTRRCDYGRASKGPRLRDGDRPRDGGG